MSTERILQVAIKLNGLKHAGLGFKNKNLEY
jgi:hypothetical protein